MMRLREKRKDIDTLANVDDMWERLKAAEDSIRAVAKQIEEADIRSIVPHQPAYSRDLKLAKKYESGEKGPEIEFLELFEDVVNNYGDGLARYQALEWFPDESLVFACNREINEVSPRTEFPLRACHNID